MNNDIQFFQDTFIFSIVANYALNHEDKKIQSLDYVSNSIYDKYIPQMSPCTFKEYIKSTYDDVKSHFNYECA